MTLSQHFRRAVVRLRAAGIDTAKLDAQYILAHVLGVEKADVTHMLQGGRDLSPSEVEAFNQCLTRRTRGRSVAKIIGQKRFWNHVFYVNDDVLDPRPDTETLVDAALQRDFDNVLDLGTGSGCILLSLLSEHTAAQGVGVDICEAALRVAQSNAHRLGLQGRAKFVHSDLFEKVQGRFDLIVSNPPYLSSHDLVLFKLIGHRPCDPNIALKGGGDGLRFYRLIAANAAQYLTPAGTVIVEIGHTQAKDVRTIFHNAGYTVHPTVKDMGGRDRVLLLQI